MSTWLWHIQLSLTVWFLHHSFQATAWSATDIPNHQSLQQFCFSTVWITREGQPYEKLSSKFNFKYHLQNNMINLWIWFVAQSLCTNVYVTSQLKVFTNYITRGLNKKPAVRLLRILLIKMHLLQLLFPNLFCFFFCTIFRKLWWKSKVIHFTFQLICTSLKKIYTHPVQLALAFIWCHCQ